MKVSEITGKEIPEELRLERGRLIDAMADSQAYLHGKKYAIYGDPDFVYGMARFILETGGEPLHCLATNGGSAWEKEMKALFDSSPFGKDCKVWPGKDLWAMRSLLFTEPVDLLIGNSYGKYLERDTKTPLLRMTFPIFDRHHHHRFPMMGYQGGLKVLTDILDKFFDIYDEETIVPAKTDYSYDLTAKHLGSAEPRDRLRKGAGFCLSAVPSGGSRHVGSPTIDMAAVANPTRQPLFIFALRY